MTRPDRGVGLEMGRRGQVVARDLEDRHEAQDGNEKKQEEGEKEGPHRTHATRRSPGGTRESGQGARFPGMLDSPAT
jgi:hypothetical protein